MSKLSISKASMHRFNWSHKSAASQSQIQYINVIAATLKWAAP